MRILHLVHQYLPEHVGGTELYTKWLTDGLQQKGHQAAIFARRSADGAGLNQRDDAGVQVWSAWNGRFHPTNRFTSTFRNAFLQQAFVQTLKQFQPNIIHIQHMMGLPIKIIEEIQKRSIPYIITLHDFWYVCANAQLITNHSQEICNGPDKFLNCAKCTLARATLPLFPPTYPILTVPLAQRNHLLQKALAGAAHIITPSRFVKNWYLQQGISPTNIEAIPLGIELPSNSIKEQTLKKEKGDEKRPLRVGYIGGLSWQKGVHILIDAFNQLPTPCQLWIAGDLTFDPAYVTALRQLAHENVTFLGKLDRDSVWQMLAQIDVIVVPSLWYETFCIVISEANAMRIPVIASNLGALAERIHDGQDGYLFPPGEADALYKILAELQANPQQLDKLRAQIAAVPTLKDHLITIENVYRHSVSGRQ